MSYMKQLTSIVDDLVQQPVRRDRWGRYVVLPEGGTKPIGYTRATTIAKGIEDSGGLLNWGKRMVAIGLAQRPDLVALVSTTPDTDKKALDGICERAAEQGGATVRRDLGTAVHGMLERSFIDPTFVAPDPYGSDIQAVHDALATARLRVVDGYSERMIVQDRHQIAGTFDLLVEDETGQRFVADYKTGSSLLGALAFAIQLSIYANADALYNQGAAADGSEDTREPMPEVSKLHGVIIHVQPGSGVCDLHWLDLAVGAEALELAIAVRQMRKSKVLSPITVEVDVVTRTKQIAAAEKILAAADGNADDEWRAWMTGRLKSLIDSGHSQLIRNSWPEGIPTLGSGKPIANHLAEPIEQAVAMIEREVGAAFPDPKPGEVLVERRKAAPARRGAADEGGEVGTPETQSVNKHARKLTVEGRTWLGAMMQAAKDANRPVNMTGPGGKKTERRFNIASSLIAFADHADDDLAQALISIAIGEELQPGHDLGDAIGTLTISEAMRLGHLARALNAGSLIPMWESDGVRITGDIQAAIAA
jgi:hypothetical protein